MNFPLEGGFSVAEALRRDALARGASCVPELEKVAVRGSTQLRCAALDVLSILAPPIAERRALEIVSESGDNEARGHALNLLARATSEDSLAVALDQLASRSVFVHDAAVRVLTLRAEPIISSELVRRFEIADADARTRIARILARRQDEVALRWLEDAFARQSPFFTPEIVTSLTAVDDPPRTALLRRVLTSDREKLRLAALLGLLDWLEDPGIEDESEPTIARLAEATIDQALGRSFWRSLPADRSFVARAARLYIERDGAAAFDRLAPLLRDVGANDAVGTTLALGILDAIDDVVTECSSHEIGDEIPLDARWTAATSEAKISIAADLRAHAGRVAAGLAWLGGDRVRTLAPRVELGERGEPHFPLLLVGVAVDRSIKTPTVRDLPEGAGVFEHQYGGYSCAPATILGFAVRMPADLAGAISPLVERWAETYGEGLQEADLDALETVAAGRLPRFSWGEEAYVESAACTPSRWLRGLSIIQFRPRVRPWEDANHWSLPRPEIVEIGPYGEKHDQWLASLRTPSSIREGVRVALVWGNSD